MANPVSTKRTTRRDALRIGGAVGVALAVGVARSANAAAQSATPPAGGMSVTRQSVSMETATNLIHAAQEKAMELGIPMAFAVVDEGGLLKAFHRMDGVNSAAAVDIVPMKAYTAALFRTPTHQLAEGVMDNVPRAASLAELPRFTLLGGGYPIMDGDVVVGGIGAGAAAPSRTWRSSRRPSPPSRNSASRDISRRPKMQRPVRKDGALHLSS